jgi:hypothetical protein
MPAWSYSALTSYETCPRRHYHTRVAKDVIEPETQALTWGSAVHKALELRVTENQPLPPGMTHWEGLIAKITDKGNVFTELQIALNQVLQQVDWFDKSVWVRGVVDVGIRQGETLVALDYKTGNPKPDSDQLQLFAALLMAVYPDVAKVKTGFVWLKTNGLDTATYHRYELPNIWDRFLPRVAQLEAAHANQDWPERRSGLCRAWCPVKQCPQNGHYGRNA